MATVCSDSSWAVRKMRMGISPLLATGAAVRGAPEQLGGVGLTHELLELHDGAVCAQLVVHRVAVRVVLAMLAMGVVELALVNGRRRRVLVDGQRSHGGRGV
jgi:hypothetical protein